MYTTLNLIKLIGQKTKEIYEGWLKRFSLITTVDCVSSWKINLKILTLMGAFAPATGASAFAIMTYYLLLSPVSSCCTPSPDGGLIGARGYNRKKKVFTRSKKSNITAPSGW